MTGEKATPMRHWTIDISDPSEWRDLTIHPSKLQQGDLWVDPHADQLRGVVESIEPLADRFVVAIQFYGFPRPWEWHEANLIRVLRPSPVGWER